jgi:DNA-binding transcriptional ArsR family regulator
VLSQKGFSVGQLAAAVGISEQNASIQLRLISSRGLICPRRSGMAVIYEPRANENVRGAIRLLHALNECYERRIPIEMVVRMATAFTHVRRIEIVRELARGSLTLEGLMDRTGIKSRALLRHLDKLESRGFIKRDRKMVQLMVPRALFGRRLLQLTVEDAGFTVDKILSGGQTGADRAALDAAIACGVPHGGWCPKGRRAEDGPIAPKYKLQEMDSGEYALRTRKNVEEGDLTLIFSHGSLSGGSLLTQRVAKELDKPCIHIDLSQRFQGLETLFPMIGSLLNRHTSSFPNIGKITVNVAGPRASGDPLIYDAVFEAVCNLLTHFGR